MDSTFAQLAKTMVTLLESKADDIRELLAKGLTVSQVAKATGAHYSQVHGIAKKQNVTVERDPNSKGIPQKDILAAASQPKTKKLTAHAGTPWTQVPDEIKQQAFDLISQHNNSSKIDKTIQAEYWVDVTGQHQVFYTLWRYRTDDGAAKFAAYIKNPTYMGNLSTDLLEAVTKACNKVRENIPVQLMTDSSRTRVQGKSVRFKFGKYRGALFTDVFLQDPGYFLFLAKNADPRYGVDPQISAFADMARQEITEKNRETSKSQYLGNIGDKVTVTATVYNIKEQEEPVFGPSYGRSREARPMMKVFRLEDKNGNKMIVNRLDKQVPNIDKGHTVTFTATIHGMFEAMGIKFTKLTRPKVAK